MKNIGLAIKKVSCQMMFHNATFRNRIKMHIWRSSYLVWSGHLKSKAIMIHRLCNWPISILSKVIPLIYRISKVLILKGSIKWDVTKKRKNCFLEVLNTKIKIALYKCFKHIYNRDYLDGIHDIQDKMPCIALTPFKHENGRIK